MITEDVYNELQEMARRLREIRKQTGLMSIEVTNREIASGHEDLWIVTRDKVSQDGKIVIDCKLAQLMYAGKESDVTYNEFKHSSR